ncbi:hypothetical protein HNP67_001399, partial [Borreliella californiensis]|nr:hypothetical protein [Borreliella californiensis]
SYLAKEFSVLISGGFGSSGRLAIVVQHNSKVSNK